MTDWFTHGIGDVDGIVGPAVALADGSLVFGLGTGFPQARIAPGSTQAGPVPDWVASRAGATIAVVRGGTANAFATIKSGPGEACAADVEILTPDGQSCGTTELRDPQPCTRITFGIEGTVFTTASTLDPSPGPSGWGGGVCDWHWWSGLLR
jgi:hypothetical protein